VTKISIIMPVLNEAVGLAGTLGTLALTDREELVVVDGGSDDATVEVARRFTPHVYVGLRGRARQMNQGALHATGEVFLFLHADCLLPEGAFGNMRRLLAMPGVAAGAFDLSLDARGFGYRLIERAANIRSRLTRVPYGDQGLFVTRETFEALDGFCDIPLMEDIEIAGRLKKLGRIEFLDLSVTASARRWQKEGLLCTTLRDWRLAFSYAVLGIPPEKLNRYYRDVR
jgi:rSAM/selenodomain-associated transferase 2